MTESENSKATPAEESSPETPGTGDAITDADPTNVKPNLLFRLVIFFSAAFLITILLLMATTFSASRSPVKQMLDLYGLHLIGIELAAILVCGFFAMAVDRRQTLAARDELIAKVSSGETTPGSGRDRVSEEND